MRENLLKFKKYLWGQNDKRILLVGAEDSDDTNEFWLSVSPLKLRIATRNSEDYENDTLFENQSIEKWNGDRYGVYEAYWRHKRFWEFLVDYFEGNYKKIVVEWYSKFGVNKALRYEFYRPDIGKGKYDTLVNMVLVGTQEGLWDYYQLWLEGVYRYVDSPHWEVENISVKEVNKI